MSQELIDLLVRSTPAEARKRLDMPARDLDAQVLRLTTTLNGQGESPERQAILAYVDARSRESIAEAAAASQPLIFTPELAELWEWARRYYSSLPRRFTPELLEWALRELGKYSEEELLAEIREIQTTGGLELKDFIHELEQEVAPRE